MAVELTEFPGCCRIGVLHDFGYEKTKVSTKNPALEKELTGIFKKDAADYEIVVATLNQAQRENGVERLLLNSGFVRTASTEDDVTLYVFKN